MKVTKIDNRNIQMNKNILFLHCCELSIVANLSLVDNKTKSNYTENKLKMLKYSHWRCEDELFILQVT